MPSDSNDSHLQPHSHGPAKKSLGQHFLVNQGAIEKINNSFDMENTTVIEIGPGRGALTKGLIDKAKQLILIEMDYELSALWSQKLDSPSKCIQGDAASKEILDQALEEAQSDHVIVISNLPYNASTAILMNLVRSRKKIAGMSLMFQKEVGDRIASDPGSKKYSSLSVLSQNWFNVDTLLRLKPGSFNPPPNVHSVVLKFTPRDTPVVNIEDEQFNAFESFLRACFAHRRKMIKKSLHHAMPQLKDVDVIFEEAGVSTGNRAESLSIEDFGRLFHLIPN